MRPEINPRYKELLVKFAGNEEARELFDLVILEKRRRDIMYYDKEKGYPKNMDSLDMLQMDLITTEAYLNGVR